MNHEKKRFLEWMESTKDEDGYKKQIIDGLRNDEEFKALIDANLLKCEDSEDIELRFYQTEAAEQASKAIGIWTMELSPGSGKTIASAEVARRFLKAGKIIFLCPNRTALGDFDQGIIHQYKQYMGQHGVNCIMPNGVGDHHHLNSPLNHIYFYTPGQLYGLKAKSPAKFDAIFKSASLFVIDEVHHFPEDDENELKIFGDICSYAVDYFVKNNKTVVAMTATHGRMDGKLPLGIPRDKVDYKLSIQQNVNHGYAPTISGIQVFMNINCDATAQGSFYNLRFKTSQDRKRYLDAVCDVMIEVWKKNPRPTCAFVQRIRDAEELCALFNQRSNLNGSGLRVLTSRTPNEERLHIVSDINQGQCLGYITCHVGSEAIDIKSLEIVHLVRRTRSLNLLMQAIGRALRNYSTPEYTKKRALLIDYGLMKGNIVNGCVGLMEFAERSESIVTNGNVVNGGPLVTANPNFKKMSFDGKFKISDIQEWVKRTVSGLTYEHMRRIVLSMMKAGMPRPKPDKREDPEYVEEILRRCPDLEDLRPLMMA